MLSTLCLLRNACWQILMSVLEFPVSMVTVVTLLTTTPAPAILDTQEPFVTRVRNLCWILVLLESRLHARCMLTCNNVSPNSYRLRWSRISAIRVEIGNIYLWGWRHLCMWPRIWRHWWKHHAHLSRRCKLEWAPASLHRLRKDHPHFVVSCFRKSSIWQFYVRNLAVLFL